VAAGRDTKPAGRVLIPTIGSTSASRLRHQKQSGDLLTIYGQNVQHFDPIKCIAWGRASLSRTWLVRTHLPAMGRAGRPILCAISTNSYG
jgi:hypothetical protein